METPKGARLVWWTRWNAGAKTLLYRRLLSKKAANVIFMFKNSNLDVFVNRCVSAAVAKSLQLEAKKKA
jgi:hypothetical protein